MGMNARRQSATLQGGPMLKSSSIFALAAIALAALAPATAAARYQAPHAFPSSAPHTGRSTGGICGWVWVAHHLVPIHC
jgi:hypothetical protein